MEPLKVGERCSHCGNVKTAGDPRIAGVYQIVHEGNTYQVPPLSFGQVRKLAREKVIEQISDLENQGQAMSDEWLGKVIYVITLALRRNYKDLSDDEIEEIIDIENMLPALQATTGRGNPAQGLPDVRPTLPASGPVSQRPTNGAATNQEETAGTA